MGRSLLLATVGALIVLATSAPGASATTWDGSCQMNGQVDSQPYHLVPESRDYVSHASGTCTGTLNGKPYDGPAQTFLDGRMGKPMSCEAGGSNGVPGWIYFGPGSPDDVDAPDTTLDVYATEAHVMTVLATRLQGAFNGETAVQSQLTDADLAAFERCAGPGSEQVHFTMKTQTLTTMYG